MLSYFPVQALDLVTAPVGERIQAAVERVVAKFPLDNGRQSGTRFPEIYWVPVQVDPGHVVCGTEVAGSHNCSSS